MPSALPKLSVRLQPDLERRLRSEAKRRSISLNQAFEEAVERWLAGSESWLAEVEVVGERFLREAVIRQVAPPGEIPW